MRPTPIYLPIWDDGKQETHSSQPKPKPRVSIFITLSLISILLGSFLYYREPSIISHCTSYLPFMSTSSQHSAAGWHARSPLHPSGDSFVPTREALALACLYSTPVQPSGLAAALFKPDIAVDAQGRVLQLSQADFAAIKELGASSVADNIPAAGGFRNQWRIKHARTSQPISWLRVVDGGAIKDVSVYGYNKQKLELDPEVDGLATLPEVLDKVFGVFAEGREGLEDGGEVNSRIVELVAAVVEQD